MKSELNGCKTNETEGFQPRTSLYINILVFFNIIIYMHAYIDVYIYGTSMNISRSKGHLLTSSSASQVEPPTIHGAVGDAPGGPLEPWWFSRGPCGSL